VRVLVADDEPVSRRLLQSMLVKWGYDVLAASDGDQAWEILHGDQAPRLALLDWMMPGRKGIEICRAVRSRVSQPYVYILLLTARKDKIDLIEGLESGADDYLTKPYFAQELRARLRVGERILELEDHLVAAREAMHFRATHDPLTGLWNRTAILDSLNRELPRAHREGRPLGILLADLDHFKKINDTYGHLAGDEVLREAARRMLSAVRSYDLVGRYGGEEFLLLLSGCDAASIFDRAEHLRRAIASEPVKAVEGSLEVTISVGAVTSAGLRELDADAFLRAADQALYRAKNAGRNQVEIVGPDELQALLQNSEKSPRLASTKEELTAPKD